jgi:hypothetical protein
MIFEFPRAPRAHEAAALIVMRAGIDDPRAIQSRSGEMHCRLIKLDSIKLGIN